MIGLMSKILVTGAACLALMGCVTAPQEPPVEQWPELQYSVDGKVDLQIRVPPARMAAELREIQFVSTALEPTQPMFKASYDPGRRSNRGLLLTSIAATVFRLETQATQGKSLALDDIKNEIYLSRDDASEQFDILGAVSLNNRQWLRINLIAGYSRGISYATIVGGHYALVMSMTVLGENSDQTGLFQTRHATLLEIIKSAKIWPE